MAGWELIGGDPAPGDPSAISSLAVEFGTTADNARDVRDRLVRLKDGATDAIWRGDTADAFRDRIDKMPEHLEKLDRSYRKASQGLDAYARELRDLKADAEAALSKAGSAKQDAQTARSNQASFNASNTDPAVSNPHDEAVSGADQRLQQAIGDANDVRGRKRSAEDRAIASLDEASDLGIKNDPWWRKALRQLSTALKIIGLVLLVIAIVVIVVIALATPGGFLAILAAIQACAFLGTLGTAMTVVGVAAFATAATQYATGDETVGLGDVALAGVFAFGPMALGRGLNYLRGARGAVQAGDDLVRAGDDVAGAADDIGRTPIRYDNLPPPPARPTVYSTAYQMRLDPSDIGTSRAVHFNRANASLDDAFRSDAQWADEMEEMIPGARNAVSSVGGRENPPGWTWEHASTSTANGQTGIMRLVPTVQHTPGSPWWRVLHPDKGARGGYSEWAIPAGAKKNR